MTSSVVLSAVTFIYGVAGFLYIFAWVFRKPGAGRLGTGVALLGVTGNAAGFILRWVESYQLGFGRAPLSNLYESLIFYALCITLVYLAVERRTANRTIGAFSMPLAFLTMAYASLGPASAAGEMPPVEALDELTHQLVVFGFLFLSAGIITGAVWANSAWGRYWGWDPKETWSLITWFIYAALLHARMTRGWRGRRIAYLSIVGFAAVLFTYFGVNLLPGLHSYQSMG